MNEMRGVIRGEIGKNIIYPGVVDSTNNLALELGEKGAAHGTVVIADQQTKGRGRLGRVWVSPPGVNIYMSVLLKPQFSPRDAMLLTVMAGVACCRALRDISGLIVMLKWPNDLLISDRKVGGILTETKFSGNMMHTAVVGIGINVNTELTEFPADVRAIATSLRNESNREYSRTTLAAAILNEMETWYDMLRRGGRAEVCNEWRRLSLMIGRAVEVADDKEVYRGIAEDIDEEGQLLIKLPTGSVITINTGDLIILR